VLPHWYGGGLTGRRGGRGGAEGVYPEAVYIEELTLGRRRRLRLFSSRCAVGRFVVCLCLGFPSLSVCDLVLLVCVCV